MLITCLFDVVVVCCFFFLFCFFLFFFTFLLSEEGSHFQMHNPTNSISNSHACEIQYGKMYMNWIRGRCVRQPLWSKSKHTWLIPMQYRSRTPWLAYFFSVLFASFFFLLLFSFYYHAFKVKRFSEVTIQWIICTSGHSSILNSEKWVPLKAIKTFIRKKMGHTT